jgi:hypothetical protein
MVTRRTACQLLAFSGAMLGLRIAAPGLVETPSAFARESAPALRLRSTAWVARHGLTSSQYQHVFDEQVDAGYRLTYVSGYNQGGQARYAAVWTGLPSTPAWAARHGLTAARYQQEFDSLVGQGYRPVLVNGYGIGGTDYYAAIFEKSSAGGSWVARHGLTAAQYQQEFDTLVGQGYRLDHVSGYSVNGQARYAGIWTQRAGDAFVARHGLTAAQYQDEFDNLTSQGFQLTTVSGYAVGSGARYAAIFEMVSPQPAWQARHGLTADQYQMAFDDFSASGYRPIVVDAYDVGGSPQFAGIWVQ